MRAAILALTLATAPALAAEPWEGVWAAEPGWCANAGQIVLFCNGPWCGQSPTAIRRIIEAGYPAEKISYYRWGMQGWRMLGLTVAGGK